jgi:hypothetical protein
VNLWPIFPLKNKSIFKIQLSFITWFSSIWLTIRIQFWFLKSKFIFLVFISNENLLCWATWFFNSAMVVFAEIFKEKFDWIHWNYENLHYQMLLLHHFHELWELQAKRIDWERKIFLWRMFYSKCISLNFCRHFLFFRLPKQMIWKFEWMTHYVD